MALRILVSIIMSIDAYIYTNLSHICSKYRVYHTGDYIHVVLLFKSTTEIIMTNL